jgi:hypothetical protein
MSRFSPLLLLWVVSLGGFAQVPPPNTLTRESTVTGTVDRVERAGRLVTFRSDENVFQTVYVDPKVMALDTLKVGDVVTVRYTESVIVQVRPDAKPTAPQDTTEEARRSGDEHVLEQQNIVVTIEEVDPQGLFVTYRTHDNRRLMHAVRDKELLKGIRRGDRIEVTLTRARAVSIERGRRELPG